MHDLAGKTEGRERPRDRLKRMTWASHQSAEGRWFGAGQFSSRAVYEQWLGALLHAHSQLGWSATQSVSLGSFRASERRRCAALEDDLGVSCFGKASDLPPNPAWSWGVLYALNGSALGASVILKSGAIDATWPRQYLEEMRGFATSGQLKSFFDGLNAAPFEAEDMVAGADAVFNLLASKAH